MLTRTNYQEWALLMRVNMQAQGLWHAIEPEEGDIIEYREDRLALAAILRAVPSEMLGSLARKHTARSAWDAVKTVRVGVQRVRDAHAKQLLKDFNDITFKDRESVDDFSLRIVGLANQVRTLGWDISDADIVTKMLQVVPDHLSQIAIAIETFLAVDTLSIEEVVGRLRQVEERRKKKLGMSPTPPADQIYDKQGRLLLSEEEWLAKLKRCGDDGSGGSISGGKKFGKPRRGRGSGGANGGGGATCDPNKPPSTLCFKCNKVGHWARYCPNKPKKGQAHVAQGEEDEHSLLMAHAVISLNPSPASPASTPARSIRAVTPSPPPPRRVDIREDRVFAQLGPHADPEPHRWVLDTGATNHMTGERSAFSQLDNIVCGTVRFGDGSVAEIEGSGTIVFSCKNGEHRALTGVYYLPRLTANIISVGQLDESGCRINIEDGILRIFEQGRKLLARVKRSPSRLYILDLKIGRPVCLSAKSEEAAWRWHARFGHLSFQLLRQLARHEMVRGLPTLEQVDQMCDACLAGKQRRASFPEQARRRTANAIELVHGDICGLITPTTPSGNQYFLLLVDDMSRYMWLVLLPGKDHAAAVIKNF
jgi:hypothetical protein